jgi:hypothetical protein
MLQTGIVSAYYEVDLVPQEEGQLAAYLQLQDGFPGGVHQLLPATVPVELLTSETVRVEVPLN